jgi:hypothetical protein
MSRALARRVPPASRSKYPLSNAGMRTGSSVNLAETDWADILENFATFLSDFITEPGEEKAWKIRVGLFLRSEYPLTRQYMSDPNLSFEEHCKNHVESWHDENPGQCKPFLLEFIP